MAADILPWEILSRRDTEAEPVLLNGVAVANSVVCQRIIFRNDLIDIEPRCRPSIIGFKVDGIVLRLRKMKGKQGCTQQNDSRVRLHLGIICGKNSVFMGTNASYFGKK